MTLCEACGDDQLVPFADLGDLAVHSGTHWAAHGDAVAAPVGPMRLAHCPTCAYVRNLGHDPELLVHDTGMDVSRHHSPAFAAFAGELAQSLTERYDLAGKRVLDLACGQGEFLRDLCRRGGFTGVGFDPRYAEAEGEDGPATFHSALPPRGEGLGEFDFFVSRQWIEQLADPYAFLVDLREQARGREVFGYVEVSDAGYELSGPGWRVNYPQVSYFAAFSLAGIFARAGWSVESTGTLFSGLYRYIEVSANRPRAGGHVAHTAEFPSLWARDKQLTAIGGFARRHRADRERWRDTIAKLDTDGERPVLWGAGARGVQVLTLADPDCALHGVIDLNPRKWGRFLPVTGHRVDPPSTLTELQPKTVLITNPAYREEIAKSLADLGVTAEILQV